MTIEKMTNDTPTTFKSECGEDIAFATHAMARFIVLGCGSLSLIFLLLWFAAVWVWRHA